MSSPGVMTAGSNNIFRNIEFHKHSPFVDILLLIALLGCAIAKVVHSTQGRPGRNSIPHVWGIPFIGSPAFYTRRHMFALEGIAKYGPIFSFNISRVSLSVHLNALVSLTIVVFFISVQNGSYLWRKCSDDLLWEA